MGQVAYGQTHTTVVGGIQATCTFSEPDVTTPSELFVMRVDTDEYSHIAALHDVVAVPVGRTAALSASAEFYRVSSMVRTFPSLQAATDFATLVQSAIPRTLRNWHLYQAGIDVDVVLTDAP